MCSGEVGDNDDSAQCDQCNKWNHTRCLNIDAEQYEKLKKDPLPWYCPNCAMEIPFSTLSNKGLKTVLFGGSSKTLPKVFKTVWQEIYKKVKNISWSKSIIWPIWKLSKLWLL